MAWKTWVFDCDGVLLNSNKVKCEAMYRAALPYGADNAKRLVDYHAENGGIGREIKFRWFFENVVEPSLEPSHAVDQLLRDYAEELTEGLARCEIAPGIHELAASLKAQGVSMLVVSGAEQAELRTVLRNRGLAQYFDGIFGSPDTKDEILAREIRRSTITKPALFLGDSRYDHEAASRAGLDFIFISDWTEFSDWKAYCADNGIVVSPRIRSVSETLESRQSVKF